MRSDISLNSSAVIFVAALLAFKFVVFRGFKEKSQSQSKDYFFEDRKVHALLFAHSFETEIGFGFGLGSYLKTKPELAIRKHPRCTE